MTKVAEHDVEQVTKLVDEAMALRSREAIELIIQCAYLIGRRTGSAETAADVKALLGTAPTERPSLSESEVKP